MATVDAGDPVLRIPDTSLREATQRVAPTDSTNARRRKFPRYPFQVPEGVVAEFAHPGGTRSTVVVAARDLSAGGIGLFHGGFVYEGTPCTIKLKALDGEFVLARGVVVRSRQVHSRIHDIGVKFSAPIEIELFVHAPHRSAPAANDAALHSPDTGAEKLD
ncbi:MAG: PilZ domain-containing protein [Phycisphaerae bacterium]